MIGREGLHLQVLLDLFEAAGAGAPRSYISTGNVSFSAADPAVHEIAADVENGIESVIGRREPVYVRTIKSLVEMDVRDPFASTPFPDAIERTVSFVPEGIDPFGLELPVESPSGRLCIFAATHGEVLSVGRRVGGRSQGAGGFVERALECRVTSRAWSTVVRIVDMPE